MKPIQSHSKNSLFLMEMIFVLLFLALSSAACVRIFAAARGTMYRLLKDDRYRRILFLSVRLWKEVTEVQTVLSSIFSEVFPLPLL